MEAACASETLASTYNIILCHNPGDYIPVVFSQIESKRLRKELYAGKNIKHHSRGYEWYNYTYILLHAFME
jgi:hypothetical protein